MLCYVMYDLDAGFATITQSADIFGADIPELVHTSSASGFHVACSSLKLPLIGFATLGAVGLSLRLRVSDIANSLLEPEVHI